MTLNDIGKFYWFLFAEVCISSLHLVEFRDFLDLIRDFTLVFPSVSGTVRQLHLGDLSCLQFDHLPLPIKQVQ